MTTTYALFKASKTQIGAAERTADHAAVHLLQTMAALPDDDPSRGALREQVIEAWLPMVKRLADRYTGRGEPIADLIQAGTIGLIKAVDRFDPSYGVDFTGYAVPTVLGEIKRHFRDRTWSIRVPRRLQERCLAITTANSSLMHTLGRSPTVPDIAAHLGITEDEVIEGLEGGRAYYATSLSTPVGVNGDTELGDTLGGEDHGYELAELRDALGPALAGLDQRKQKILALRFYGNLTQAQIAERVGVSQMHVSRLIAQALNELRQSLDIEVC